MANYSKPYYGTQALNTSYQTDFMSNYHNKILYNIFNAGVINNFTNVSICNENGISTPISNEIVIEWNNSEYGELPLTNNLYVKIELYKENELFYIIDVKANNDGIYTWNLPPGLDFTGFYKLKITGTTDGSYKYIVNPWWIQPTKDKYLKLRNQLSLFIQPNNAYTLLPNIKLKFDHLTDSLDSLEVAQLKYMRQLLKMDTTDNIILQVPDSLSYPLDLYVIAEFNWIEDNDRNAVLFFFNIDPAENNQLNICKIRVNGDGNIDEIYITDEGLLEGQTISTINENIKSFVNVDKLNDIYDASNLENDIPINNDILNINLNTEMVDGFTSSDLALKNDLLNENLNSEYIGNLDGIYKPGNESMNIPIANGLLNENLNAEYINGMSDVDLMTMKHSHPFNDINITDGAIFKKLRNVETITFGSENRGQATNDSFNIHSFELNNIAPNAFLRGGKFKTLTGTIKGEYTNSSGQIHIGYDDNTFTQHPLILLQVISDNSYRYIENVLLGSYTFMTDKYIIEENYNIEEGHNYIGDNVKLIIAESSSGFFELSDDDTINKEITANVVTGDTTVEDIITAINDKSKMITARLTLSGENENLITEQGTFQTSGGYQKAESTFIKAYTSNISQSGFVLNWQKYMEDEIKADGLLYKQTGSSIVWINWIAIGMPG